LNALQEPDSAAPGPPIAPFREAVADKAKTTNAMVDLILADVGVHEETATRPADHLTIRRLVFSGTKRASGYEDGPFTFEWKDLGPGLFAALTDGVNQVGKSTILEVLLWAMRGHPRGLKPEVRSWIDTVEVEFTIGADRYCIDFTDFDSIPRGKLVMVAPGPARILRSFEGEEAFETAMGDLMMTRFSLQPIPNVSHTGDETSQYYHAWSAYAASMFIEGSHPAILGDVTVGALWWRMLHLFVGMPYAATHMALRNAVTLEQAQRDGEASARSRQDAFSAEIRRNEAEKKKLENELKALGAPNLNLEEIDALTMEHARLSRDGIQRQSEAAEAERDAQALKAEKDEARAALRRLQEGAASKRIFAGLRPVCCPRCAEVIPESRAIGEDQSGRCAVCDRNTLHDDQDALEDSMAAASARVDALSSAETLARNTATKRHEEAKALERRREETATKLRKADEQASALRTRREIEGKILRIAGALEQLKTLAKASRPATGAGEERLRVLKAAEVIAEARMKSASADLFKDLEGEVVAVAKRFGFRGLETIAIRGNGINLMVSGVPSGYSKQTAGQRLRLRIALVIAMMRMADRSGYGNHPGVLFIDSPGSEELSDDDLVAMVNEIRQVASETPNVQIFLASARGDLLRSAVLTKNIKQPADSGAMF